MQYECGCPWTLADARKQKGTGGFYNQAIRRLSPIRIVDGGADHKSAKSGNLTGFRQHARAITTDNRRGTVRRSTRNLVKGHLPGMAVVEADDHHSEVQEIGDDRE